MDGSISPLSNQSSSSDVWPLPTTTKYLSSVWWWPARWMQNRPYCPRPARTPEDRSKHHLRRGLHQGEKESAERPLWLRKCCTIYQQSQRTQRERENEKRESEGRRHTHSHTRTRQKQIAASRGYCFTSHHNNTDQHQKQQQQQQQTKKLTIVDESSSVSRESQRARRHDAVLKKVEFRLRSIHFRFWIKLRVEQEAVTETTTSCRRLSCRTQLRCLEIKQKHPSRLLELALARETCWWWSLLRACAWAYTHQASGAFWKLNTCAGEKTCARVKRQCCWL